MAYAIAEPEERYRVAATARTKLPVVEALVERHQDDQVLVIGAYLDQLHELGEFLDAPIIQGATTNKERERLFDAFRAGEIRTLVLSKVGNFSIDLPEAAVAIQVSGTFGSRQEEAQRLGRVLRPKADGRQAHFYTVVSATRSTPSTPPTASASSPSRATPTPSSTPIPSTPDQRSNASPCLPSSSAARLERSTFLPSISARITTEYANLIL